MHRAGHLGADGPEWDSCQCASHCLEPSEFSISGTGTGRVNNNIWHDAGRCFRFSIVLPCENLSSQSCQASLQLTCIQCVWPWEIWLAFSIFETPKTFLAIKSQAKTSIMLDNSSLILSWWEEEMNLSRHCVARQFWYLLLSSRE